MTTDHAADRIGRLCDRVRGACHPDVLTGTDQRPDRTSVGALCGRLLSLAFPGAYAPERLDAGHLDACLLVHLGELEALLIDLVARAAPAPARQVRERVAALTDELPEVLGLIATDVEAAFTNDPAATDRAVIILSYPGLEALAVQRFAHRLYHAGLGVLARMMTEHAHGRTGIDIHPGAHIDEHFFIDHGTGVVVGETSRIGRHCVLYHGVTLGAWNPTAKDDQGQLRRGMDNKRHPDLEDHVTVYPGATILGGDTVIGHHSVIGGNVWLTASVEAYSVVTIKDPELDIRRRRGP